MPKIKIQPLNNRVTILPEKATKGAKVFKCSYIDPFSSDKTSRIHDESKRLSDHAAKHYQKLGIRPKRTSRVDWTNPATTEIFDKTKFPAIHRWRTKYVPTAEALIPLQRPDLGMLYDGTVLSNEEAAWFAHTLDAIGLRSRAAVMQEVLVRISKKAEYKNWLSLASGASLPILQAAVEVKKSNKEPSITAVDYDKNALKISKNLASQFDVRKFKISRANILDEKSLRKVLKDKKSDVVEILGLFEYLNEEDWFYRYHKVVVRFKRKLLGAKNFLNLAYSFVDVGGVLIFGNMLDSHPHLSFTLDVIQWPHIKPRSIKEVLDIVKHAQLPGEYEISIYLPEDGVYALYVLHRIS